MIKIGITERNDAGLDFSWYEKRNNYNGLILITKKLSDEFIEKVMDTNCIVHTTITGLGSSICLSVKKEIFTERKQCPNKCLYCYWK